MRTSLAQKSNTVVEFEGIHGRHIKSVNIHSQLHDFFNKQFNAGCFVVVEYKLCLEVL